MLITHFKPGKLYRLKGRYTYPIYSSPTNDYKESNINIDELVTCLSSKEIMELDTSYVRVLYRDMVGWLFLTTNREAPHAEELYGWEEVV